MMATRAIITFFFAAMLTCHCSGQNLQGTVVNKGLGTNASSRIVKFSYLDGFTTVKDSAYVFANGAFRKKFGFSSPVFVTMIYGTFRRVIYVFPGAKLRIKFDPSSQEKFEESFAVIGDYGISSYLDSIEHSNMLGNYINSRVNVKGSIDAVSQILKNYDVFCDSFRNACFSGFKVKPEALREFCISDSVNERYYGILSACDYLTIVKNGDKTRFRTREITSKITFSNSDAYMISEYYRHSWLFVLRSWYDSAMQANSGNSGPEANFTSFSLDYIRSHNVTGPVKGLIYSQLLGDILRTYSRLTPPLISRYDSLIVVLESGIDDRKFLAEFNRHFNEEKGFQGDHMKGKPAPDFIAYDTSGRIYDLSSFQGKVLIMDVWASWCLPCIQEFPYLRSLEQKLDSGKFRLVTISVDNTRDRWIRDGVSMVRPPGLPLWVSTADTERFIRDYNCSLIPDLILVDSQGLIVNFTAPRASDSDRLYRLIVDTIRGASR